MAPRSRFTLLTQDTNVPLALATYFAFNLSENEASGVAPLDETYVSDPHSSRFTAALASLQLPLDLSLNLCGICLLPIGLLQCGSRDIGTCISSTKAKAGRSILVQSYLQHDAEILHAVEALRSPGVNLISRAFWLKVAGVLPIQHSLEDLGWCCYRRSFSSASPGTQNFYGFASRASEIGSCAYARIPLR